MNPPETLSKIDKSKMTGSQKAFVLATLICTFYNLVFLAILTWLIITFNWGWETFLIMIFIKATPAKPD